MSIKPVSYLWKSLKKSHKSGFINKLNGPYHSQKYNWKTLVSNVASINAYKLKIYAQALV